MDTHNPKLEQEAQQAGREAGRIGTAAGLNPHPVGSALAKTWERARIAEVAKLLTAAHRMRARAAICRYKAELECDCGGRGFCLDVA